MRKVLVVDDEREWRDFVRICLDDLGYQTIEAANGQEALDSIARESPSIVLLDMRMPGMSGEEVLRQLPDDGPRIVCFTAAPAHEVRGALRGPHYYLPKGASREELALLLQSLEV